MKRRRGNEIISEYWDARLVSQFVVLTSIRYQRNKPNVKLSPIKQGLETFPRLGPCVRKDGCTIQLERRQKWTDVLLEITRNKKSGLCHWHTCSDTLFYIPMYSLPDLINHLIILSIFTGCHTHGTIVGENKLGLYDVSFGNNQKATEEIQMAISIFLPPSFPFPLHLLFWCFLALSNTLLGYRLIYSPLSLVFLSPHTQLTSMI